jgi:RimJ/RimL family protein N-acetyltransferase
MWRVEDAPALARAISASTEHLRPWMRFMDGEPRSLDERRMMIASWRRAWEGGGDALYAIVPGEGGIVGSCGLHRRLGPDALEIGYWVATGFLRRGLASATAALLTDAAFALPGIERVEIRHDVANLASEGVPRTLGFEPAEEVEAEPGAPADTGINRVWRMERGAWIRRPGRRPPRIE